MRRTGAPHVYFVRRADGAGPVKIGCTGNPTVRLNGLMCWSPYPLVMVATTPGDETLERRFHAHFKVQHSHGEWFHPSAELNRVMAAIAAGAFDISALPERGWTPSSGRRGKTWTEGQRLAVRVSHLCNRSGIAAPEDVRKAADGFERLGDDERDAARALVLAHLDAPLARGSVMDYPWARDLYAKYAAKHGLPALAEAA